MANCDPIRQQLESLQSQLIKLKASPPPPFGILAWEEQVSSLEAQIAATRRQLKECETPPLLMLEWSAANPTLPDLCSGAGSVVGGDTFPSLGQAAKEWTPVLDPSNEWLDSVGLSGSVVMPQAATDDFPFTHPFGYDWECKIAPDVQYSSLLAPGNFIPNDSTAPGPWASEDIYLGAIAAAKSAGYPQLTLCGQPGYGVLGVELDAGLIPDAYRASAGDRIAAYGRWIVDDGHGDFHLEMHQPLVMIWAREIDTATPLDTAFAESVIDAGGTASVISGSSTFSRIISRPYFVSQLFSDGAPFFQHMINDLKGSVGSQLGSSLGGWIGGDIGDWIEGTINAIADILQIGSVDARAVVYPTAFIGNHALSFVLRPPYSSPDPTWQLCVSGHVTVRQGITVSLAPAGTDGLTVTIAMQQVDPCQAEQAVVNQILGSIAHLAATALRTGLTPGQVAQLVKWNQALIIAQTQLMACRASNPTSSIYTAADLRAPRDEHMTVADAVSLKGDTAEFWLLMIPILADILAGLGAGALAAAIEQIQIDYYKYDPVPDPQPTNAGNATDTIWAAPVDSLAAGAGVTVDDSQPFPIYGWLNVGWCPPPTSTPGKPGPTALQLQ